MSIGRITGWPEHAQIPRPALPSISKLSPVDGALAAGKHFWGMVWEASGVRCGDYIARHLPGGLMSARLYRLPASRGPFLRPSNSLRIPDTP